MYPHNGYFFTFDVMKLLLTLTLLLSLSTRTIEERKMVWYYNSGGIKTETLFTDEWLVKSFKQFNEDGTVLLEVEYDSVFSKYNYLDKTDPAWEFNKRIGTMPVGQVSGNTLYRGQQCVVHYICFSNTGQQFDNSFQKNMPLEFVVGSPNLLTSFSRGLTKFKPGQYGFLYIPSYLGYGDVQMGNVPPNSDLYYFIQVLPQK